MHASVPAHKAQLLDRRKTSLHQLSEIRLSGRTRSEGGRSSRGLPDRLYGWRKRVAQQHGPPRAEKVHVLITIRIGEVRARRTGHERRMAAHRTKCPDWRIHTSRQKSFCPGLQRRRTQKRKSHTSSVWL